MPSVFSHGAMPDPVGQVPAVGSGQPASPIDVDQSAQCRARWEMRANCSMSPAAVLGVLGSLAGVSLLIGGFFWWMGAPGVLPFACVEMLCLGLALVRYAGRATDGDVVEWVGSELRVRSTRRGCETVTRMPASWTRIRCTGSAGIELSSGRQRVLVGRQVRAERRMALARAMRDELFAAQAVGDSV